MFVILQKLCECCQMTLPTMFSQEMSYYEDLCKLKYIIGMIKDSEKELAKQVGVNTSDIVTLKQQMQQIYDGDYEFLEGIIEKSIKNVWFGLTQSGYFVAYIPESWSDIKFATSGYDTIANNVNYGHLILKY